MLCIIYHIAFVSVDAFPYQNPLPEFVVYVSTFILLIVLHYVDEPELIHSLVKEHCYWFLAIMNKTTVNIPVQIIIMWI